MIILLFTGGAWNGTFTVGFELAGLLACMWAMLSLQEGDGELQVLHLRILPHCLQMHVQREILSCPFQLICWFEFIAFPVPFTPSNISYLALYISSEFSERKFKIG